MRTLAGCLLVVLTATVVVRSADPALFHHDVGWILYTAGEMLDGSELYADILDENPPLVFWLNVPVVGVARGLGLDPLLLFNLAVWLAIVGCTGLGVFAWLGSHGGFQMSLVSGGVKGAFRVAASVACVHACVRSCICV